jgi:hypothetical protein
MLDLIRLMLESINFRTPISNNFDISCRHGIEQRENLSGTKHRYAHVLLHRFNR